MFALLIGIDHYESSQVSDLRGCNKDVTAIHKWLTNSYNLLQDNTHVLRNKQATAKSIRDAIRNHLIDNDSIGRDTPIVIFFAGHGSRISPAFPEDDHIELICAFDHHVSPQIGDPKIEEKRPICDYEVADLISELASKRGNNITIILDCCHSGGINRREGIRECETDIGWRNYLVKGCNASRNVGVGLPRAGWYCDWESHILLAACEPEQSAGESAEGGRFTCALLGRFEQVGRGATYSQLMSGLSISTYQNPQCTGTHRNRTLFTLHTSGPLLTVGPGDNDSSISLPVGEFHGIREQSLFELRQVGALVGEFCVMAVTATSCFVQPVVPQTRIPEIGSLVDATILRYSNSEPVIFYVDSADIPLTSQISSLGVSSLAGGVNIKFVPNRACAHITISPHNGGYSTDLISVTQGPRFSATDNNSVIDAIGLAARFYLHLHRSCSAVLAPQVKLRLFKLLRGKLEEIPNVNGRANIAPGKFVLVIENKSNDDLCTWATCVVGSRKLTTPV